MRIRNGALGIATMLWIAACGPIDPAPSPGVDTAQLELATDLAPGCTFERGVTTCVTTTERTEQVTHLAYSGCVAWNGTDFVPGRSVTTYLDTYAVTETTTTKQRGIHGDVFETSTVEQRTLVESTPIDRVCEPT